MISAKKIYPVLSVIILMPLFSSPAYGATYYVATNGHDAGPGTASQPWRTIQRAASSMVAGDTVYIRAGTYRERIVPQNSGSDGSSISYASHPGEVVTIDGSGIILQDDTGLIDIANRRHIRISGLRVVNAGPGGTSVGIRVSQSSYITVEKNYTYNTASSGILVWGSNNIIIDGNEVELASNAGALSSNECITVGETDTFEIRYNHVHHGNAMRGEGIDAKDGSSNGLVYGNHVHDIPSVGIYIDAWDKHTHSIDVFNNYVHDIAGDGFSTGSEQGGLLENIRFYNNIAHNNRWVGITIHNCCIASHPLNNIQVINNTFHNNGNSSWGGGILFENPQATNVVIRNNIVSQNMSFQIAFEGVSETAAVTDHNLISGFRGHTGEIYGRGHVDGNPLFINPGFGGFRLQKNSPAINRGSSLFAPASDLDGTARPQGGAHDIGAFEFVNAVPVPDIDANNSDGPITISTTDSLSISVSLNSRSEGGHDADWWVAVNTPYGWDYYVHPGFWHSGADLNSIFPAYQGALFNFFSPVVLLSTLGLSPGTYHYYFAVDLLRNGQVDFDHLHYDGVTVNVQ